MKELDEDTKEALKSNAEDMIDTIMQYTETKEERIYMLDLFKKGLLEEER